MAKHELSVEDEMDILESKFYPEAISFKAAKLAVSEATGLGDLSRATVKATVIETNINYLLDKWLDLRQQLGASAIEAGYERAAA